MPDPESLRRKIVDEETRLARIEKERAEALGKLQELKDRLAVEESAPTSPKPVQSAYSDAIRPPFRGQTGHCSDVNPATVPRGIRPAFRADSGHFS